jgi:four helix bundle protein
MSKVQRPTSNVSKYRLIVNSHPFFRQIGGNMVIERFEDIESWKKARKLTEEIYEATAIGEFFRDFGLKDQIRKASVSILSNIAEGFERGGDKEFSQFLGIAKGSCGEVRAQLYVALDQGYLSRESFASLSTKAIEVSQLLSGFIRYLKGSALRGNKYR